MTMNRVFFLISLVFSVNSCSFTKRIKDGETAFERKQYAVAIPILEEEFAKSKSSVQKSRKAFLLGKSYLKIQELKQAQNWFTQAVTLGYGSESEGNLANTLKQLEQYSLAIPIYEKIGRETGRVREFEREILFCRQASELITRPTGYKAKRLYENTITSEYAPALFDGEFLVFTSERLDATGGGIYNWTGEKFSDLFIMYKNGGDLKRFDTTINTDQNEGSASFSRDNLRMYFTRCYSFGNGDDYCKLMVSYRDNGFWTEPEVLPFIQDKVSYGQPTLIENDSILLFSSDMTEVGGTFDLYYTQLFEDGSWSVPDKLPSSINSQGNEKFPTGDGDTLYFSSDFLPGLGGYDIFKTYLKADKSWSYPQNMGSPINSGADDFSFLVDNYSKKSAGIAQQGFFVSNRLDGNKDDIYTFVKTIVIEQPKEVAKVEPKKYLYLTVSTKKKNFEIENDPNSKLKGNVILNNVFIKVNSNDSIPQIESYTDGFGVYLTEVKPNKNFTVTASKIGYLNATTDVSTYDIIYDENQTTKTINVILVLDKIYEDKEINLSNIYYDYDKWDIKTDALPALNNLVKILVDNPQINIQLSSHTDCRGEVVYNETLSQKRAQSVVDFLIDKGIKSDRLIAKGYGESQLIDGCLCDNCTEDQHQSNRRTTFKILKK